MNTKNNQKPVVAAFDFDGTLTDHDTLVHFLLFAAGPVKFFYRLIKSLPSLVAFSLGKSTRQDTKEAILTEFFKGTPIETVRKLGEEFAFQKIPKRLKPEGLERLTWHQKQGHRCVLVSASLDIYLKPWAKSANFNEIVSSQLEADSNGIVTGKLIGKNCRRAEKVQRLNKLLGPRDNYVLYAYGDSKGDHEMLETADFPYYRKFSDNG